MNGGVVPGMAHFAGTGPAWTHCHQCRHWSGKRPKGDLDSIGKGQCDKAARMLRRKSTPKVPGVTMACKHYEASNA